MKRSSEGRGQENRIMSIFRRKPDIVIGGTPDAPYLLRWYIIPRNRWCNVYLHKFLRSDDPRALHDHPWAWFSLIFHGAYLEYTPATGGFARRLCRAWRPRWGLPSALHRVELLPDHTGRSEKPVWTLFLTGPRVREWGFQCGDRWVDWRTFLGARPGASTSAGLNRVRSRGCE